nr:helix-turn-helix transcriptional regulator [Paenibacillus polymyxa]
MPLSPSYFSRLSAKETGENFTTYLAKLKIKWAKQLLEVTDMPISQISDELGFNESGYFIKIFKNSKRSRLPYIANTFKSNLSPSLTISSVPEPRSQNRPASPSIR